MPRHRGGDTPSVPFARAVDLAVESWTIIEAYSGRRRLALIGDNFSELPDEVLERHRDEYYGETSVTLPPVQLVRLPSGARLCGGEHFLVRVDGVLVEEQIPPYQFIPRDAFHERAWADQQEITVADPAVLVSRFGYMTWGHWLGELLPRAALAEARFPGEFRYVVPIPLGQASAPRNVFNSITESLEAVGVGQDRWLMTRFDRDYVFESLHLLTDVWIGPGVHPESLRRMRALLVDGSVRSMGRRIALLRTGATRRTIANVADVIMPLRSRGFEFVDVAQLPAREQVHLFATADAIVSVLSSELTGLQFAPEGAAVLTLAPKGYLNSFFYSMMTERHHRLYDLRGAIASRHPESAGYSSFEIDPGHLATGLHALDLA